MMDYEFLDTYYELMTCFMNPVSTNLRISCNKVTLLFFKKIAKCFFFFNGFIHIGIFG